MDEAFVCGPHAMNDEVEAALLAAGVRARAHPRRTLRRPAQRPPTPRCTRRRRATPTTARITIVRDGLTREVAFQPGDASILAAAARAGLDVPYSCTSGVCATCRAKLLEGQVRMDRNFALEQADLDAGFVLTCQSHPLTERVVRLVRRTLMAATVARPRSAGYDGQREQILARRGAAVRAPAATPPRTMNEVAAACGISKATLYHYVRDKHDLLAQIARRPRGAAGGAGARGRGAGLAPDRGCAS